MSTSASYLPSKCCWEFRLCWARVYQTVCLGWLPFNTGGILEYTMDKSDGTSSGMRIIECTLRTVTNRETLDTVNVSRESRNTQWTHSNTQGGQQWMWRPTRKYRTFAVQVTKRAFVVFLIQIYNLDFRDSKAMSYLEKIIPTYFLLIN